jgi:DNA primase
MTISTQVIDQIRLSTDIAEIVREYVPTMKKAGRNWRALCPFHHEKTPSFMVSPEKGIFHCFGCHAGGDIFKFVMLMDNISWPEAVKKLGARLGITIEETREDTVKRSEKQKIYDLLESACEFYHKSLKQSADAAHAREYLKKRGVTAESIEKFKIGYAPRKALLQAAVKTGRTPEELIASGVMTKTEKGTLYEYMSERIVFPIIDTHGRVVAFGGRTLKDEQPKYINTPETSVYSKSSHLYGLFQSLAFLRQDRRAVVLEGYMDVVVTHQLGVGNTVAPLGTSFTLQHSHLISRYAEELTLLFDADAAGKNAARRALEIFLDTDLAMKVVNLPDGLDPDEFIISKGKDKFLEFLKNKGKSSHEFLSDCALESCGNGTPEQKAKSVAELVPLISKVHNSIIRREWIRHIASRLDTREEDVRQELDRWEKKLKRLPGNGAKKAESAGAPIRSAEEEMLQLLAVYPEFFEKVSENVFKEARTRSVYALLVKGVPVSQITESLEGDDVAWFTELLLEEKVYAYPEQTIMNILKDMNNSLLRIERQKLEKEVTMMGDGQIPFDAEKYKLYQELTKQLKGSETHK